MTDEYDLVSKLDDIERVLAEKKLQNISPDDAKYASASEKLAPYLSAGAEWIACVQVQEVLLETRVEFGLAEQKNLDELKNASRRISALNMALIEAKLTKHDQLAVLEEIGRYVSKITKALLHPGTTSYDILDTARTYLFKQAWKEVIRPEISKSIDMLCGIAQKALDDKILQVGRTHLQNTSPVPFGATLAGYAARLAERVEKCDMYFVDLRGKVSGIVGTGASIEMLMGREKSIEFEKKALEKLGLKPDCTATQVVQKERLADVGHGLTSLMHVLGDFADDIRLMYSSAIGEVTSRSNKERLGGSSADATKNNPINWENISGKVPIVESGMRILYDMINTDFQRDLRSSVQARYQPQQMMTQTYESFNRLNKRCLPQLSINTDRMEENLMPVRKKPSEAMVATLRGTGFVHSQYGVGHNFVKEMGKKAQLEGATLMEVSLADKEFSAHYKEMDDILKEVLQGKVEKYIGHSYERAETNLAYARGVVRE